MVGTAGHTDKRVLWSQSCEDFWVQVILHPLVPCSINPEQHLGPQPARPMLCEPWRFQEKTKKIKFLLYHLTSQ